MTYNPMDLTGRAVLVTGASSGLGRAAAVLMARLGARLFLLARNPERLQQTFDSLEGTGHEFLSFDLSRVDEIPDMMSDAVARFAPFSAIVHFAGLIQTKPLQVCRPSDYESLYRVNVLAAMQLLRGWTKPGIAAAGDGAAVLVSSVLGLVASAGMGAYATSKAALLGLVRASALELARLKIRVNALLPGHVQTSGTGPYEHCLTQEQVLALERKHPLGFGRPEDVAHAAAFLISDASRWMTGSYLVVDGGYTAQ